jgi:hypothetical protein
MRTTIRVDDELLLSLKEEARRQNISLARLLDRTLRAGMEASREPRRPKRRYREQTHAMGAPSLSLDKALALAATLEDNETVRKTSIGAFSAACSQKPSRRAVW